MQILNVILVLSRQNQPARSEVRSKERGPRKNGKKGTCESFITLKDHKENFHDDPKRLINPAKNEMGRISTDILDGINQQLRNKLNIKQWKNRPGSDKKTKNLIRSFYIVLEHQPEQPGTSNKMNGWNVYLKSNLEK